MFLVNCCGLSPDDEDDSSIPEKDVLEFPEAPDPALLIVTTYTADNLLLGRKQVFWVPISPTAQWMSSE